jgi:uncharacterized membrane-anchored protein YjiN (DUF445 family)
MRLDYTQMRGVAAGALFALGAGLLCLGVLKLHSGVWGFVRAFCEAGLVGGLADWFAVTALFRKPMGLPIAHTAIIPTQKDRIGAALAGFLHSHFLKPQVIAKRMQRLDIAGLVATYLISAPRSHDNKLRNSLSRVASDMLKNLDIEILYAQMKGIAENKLRAIALAPMLGQGLSAWVESENHVALLQSLAHMAHKAIQDNEALLRDMVQQRAGTFLRWTGLDENISDALLSGVYQTLEEMVQDVHHPLFQKAQAALEKLADDLQHNADHALKINHFRDTVMASPSFQTSLQGLWEKGYAWLVTYADNLAGGEGKAKERGSGSAFLSHISTAFLANAALRAQSNRMIRRAVIMGVSRYGEQLVAIVSDTIKTWDGRTMSARLEQLVGRDLQYIRLNGTLVGGLVGVVLHTAQAVLG